MLAGLSVPELRRRRFIGKGEMENPWAIAESLERDWSLLKAFLLVTKLKGIYRLETCTCWELCSISFVIYVVSTRIHMAQITYESIVAIATNFNWPFSSVWISTARRPSYTGMQPKYALKNGGPNYLGMEVDLMEYQHLRLASSSWFVEAAGPNIQNIQQSWTWTKRLFA